MKKKIFAVAACAACLCVTATACVGTDDPHGAPFGNYRYDPVGVTGFQDAETAPVSTFSLDKNTATYSLVRSQINTGLDVAPDSVRIEEMINYFDYSFPAPEEGESVRVTAYLGDCPWNTNNKLLLAGLKTTEIKLEATHGNYVFLIDVSGSMDGETRLGLAKKSVELLLENLDGDDVLSVVTYADDTRTVVDSAACTDENKREISEAVSGLTAYGGTNGAGGLERAYDLAQKYPRGNNRVLMISDGDFNVGMSDRSDMKEFIKNRAKDGTYLTVLGVGMGNTRDDMLETLATCGNGNYAYLDNETEAKKVLGGDIGGTLVTVAKDAKAKVTFTDAVEKYRLIGYDTKRLSEDDYNNGKTDAGEIGSNLCVAALYEIMLDEESENDVYAQIEVSYRDVTGESPVAATATASVTADTAEGEDLPFIACVAEFGLVLRQSGGSVADILSRLAGMDGYLGGDPYKMEFRQLVAKTTE